MSLPVERGLRLCIVAIPSHMSVNDLFEFTNQFREHMQHIRILRDTTPYQYMAIIQFDEQAAADEFYIGYNGRPFNMLERETCKVLDKNECLVL